MTRAPSYHHRKPIRRDRVALVAVVLTAIIVLPFVFRSGDSRDAEPLDVVAVGADGETTYGALTETTEPASETAAVAAGTETDGAGRIRTYTVTQGDTLASVASSLSVGVAILQASNELLSASDLTVGRVLYASTSGIVHRIKSGQTLTDIALTYAVPTAAIAEANGIATSATIFAGQRLVIPGITSSYWTYVIQLSKGLPTRFIWPVLGEVAYGYGWRNHPVYGTYEHNDGIDIDLAVGTVIRAAAQGEVFYYGEQAESGNTLIIMHAEGFVTLYAHLSNALVYAGQFVEAGQAIAQSGDSGVSYGPHLYFEIRNGDFPVDPLRYLP